RKARTPSLLTVPGDTWLPWLLPQGRYAARYGSGRHPFTSEVQLAANAARFRSSPKEPEPALGAPPRLAWRARRRRSRAVSLANARGWRRRSAVLRFRPRRPAS